MNNVITLTTNPNKILITSAIEGEEITGIQFIIVTVIFIAGSIVSEELNKGTIKLLLVKPYSRRKILFAKLMACLFVLLTMYIIVNITYFIVTGITYGFNNYSNNNLIYNFNSGSVENISTFKYMLLSDTLLLPKALIAILFTLMISTIFNIAKLELKQVFIWK